MGFLDRLLGRPDAASRPAAPAPSRSAGRPPRGDDEAAIERYTYLLRTAPPDQIEQAHAEAFAQLTPDQRAEVLRRLSAEVPASERAASADPAPLARMATRAELRRPGTLERSFGGVGGGYGGVGMGGLIAGGLLSSVAGAFIGTAIADAMFDLSDSDTSDSADDGDTGAPGDGGGADGSVEAAGDYGDSGDGGGDYGGDFGGGDFGGFA